LRRQLCVLCIIHHILVDKLIFDQVWRHGNAVDGTAASPLADQNRCYLQARRIEPGLTQGEVRFAFTDYKTTGEYDVRFFEGDSRDGNGVVCRGHRNLDQDSQLVCALEAAFVSESILVKNEFVNKDMVYYAKDAELPPQLPGMEMFCAGPDDCTRLQYKHHLRDGLT
jgi:hypothetical protein